MYQIALSTGRTLRLKWVERKNVEATPTGAALELL
jgi:hypothetical protein